MTHDGRSALLNSLDRLHGQRWRVLVELGLYVGLRPEEIFGLHTFRIDLARHQVHVTHVMTRHGLREYPKSKRSHRVAPIPDHIVSGIQDLTTGRSATLKDCACRKVGEPRPTTVIRCPGLLFTAPAGGPINDGKFRDRIWYPAIEAARHCGKPPAGENDDKGTCGEEVCDDPSHQIPRYSPDVMRHTSASWLVMDGVPLYDVQALLGHESPRTTQRYAHLAPGAHDKVVQSWTRRIGQQPADDTDASVTHEEAPRASASRKVANSDAPVTHEEEEPDSSAEE